jgi:tRNA U34 5-methylaminomethyl-2-thiouridine-forming methyltransferase MnmC
MSSIKIIETSDGSHSLLNEELNETYHSVHGAIQESSHVFINQGLDYYLEKERPEWISILEVGFGTGLNVLLTIQKALTKAIRVNYTTLELFPLDEGVWSELNYAGIIGLQNHFNQIHQSAWNTKEKILPDFELLKLHTSLQEVVLQPDSFDLIYFDAFAPSKQPELWELPVLQKIKKSMNLNGVFVTYCAKGQLKRDLRTLGLFVETLPGPPGKKEMVRAVKSGHG